MSELIQQRPAARDGNIPRSRWRHQEGHALWNRAAVSALRGHASSLVDLVPRDIDAWCPWYPKASTAAREGFWIGFLSALAKHESTYREDAVGGGGRWHGLLQILPATARGYGCTAQTGADLRKGAANLSCALRIMSVTVARDGVVHGRDSAWRGISADWGPMRSAAKRADIAGYTRGLPVCRSPGAVRPLARP